jgi:hypothetical protein
MAVGLALGGMNGVNEVVGKEGRIAAVPVDAPGRLFSLSLSA